MTYKRPIGPCHLYIDSKRNIPHLSFLSTYPFLLSNLYYFFFNMSLAAEVVMMCFPMAAETNKRDRAFGFGWLNLNQYAWVWWGWGGALALRTHHFLPSTPTAFNFTSRAVVILKYEYKIIYIWFFLIYFYMSIQKDRERGKQVILLFRLVTLIMTQAIKIDGCYNPTQNTI